MKLNYKSFGQGEPIIILHGLFGMLDNWQTIAKKLAEQYWVFVVDLRNHGKSPHHPIFNYQAMVEDIHEFMENQWIYNASIIGHSMGGKVAMQLAFSYPETINKLIIVDIAPKQYARGHDAIFEALFSLKLDQISSRKEAIEELKAKIQEEGVRQFLLKNLARTKEGTYQWKMNLPVIYEHYPTLMNPIEGEKYEGETLFIRGDKSTYILDEDWINIGTLFPNYNSVTIANAGHWVHADAPLVLLETIFHFLNLDSKDILYF